ncbi:1,2-phenylacetyl-CoA epoxidase subunit PaaB [Halocatena halophila]|uniref:1,2-phenylacetyl-CoA epoxidase subunit PaaB n=1 Tax=Halocatena halophila TaxID=2814576 RepID=UPI002ED468C4
MIWEVFRQDEPGGYHTHCGNVHAPDREMALLFAEIQHARRKPTNSLWVVPQKEIASQTDETDRFGGTTDKTYRWVSAYNVDVEFAKEIEDSDREQRSVAGDSA